MTTRPIKNVLILGATGNIGAPIIDSLLAHPAGFQVFALTRDPKKSNFPDKVKVLQSDYSTESLEKVFRGQDALVSAVGAAAVPDQKRLVDIAIQAGIQRFLPSEYGMDTALAEAARIRPSLAAKQNVVNYLKENEDKISWSAVIVGNFFDWSFDIPGFMGWNLPERKAIIYDGGNVEWEATNVKRVADAVAATLAPEHLKATANQYVYVNSFTTTQNKVLAALEKAVGQKFEVQESTAAELAKAATERQAKNKKDVSAVFDLIASEILNLHGLNYYSKKTPGGLWNEWLGLPAENMEESVARIAGRMAGKL
jgi:nucleoside-diphosphate-sugar epimerase